MTKVTLTNASKIHLVNYGWCVEGGYTYMYITGTCNLVRYIVGQYEETVEDVEFLTHSEFEAYVSMMDDDLREQVHAALSPCTDDEFLARYQELHVQKYGEELTI